MKLIAVLLVFTRLFCVENRMLPRNYKRDVVVDYDESTLRYPVSDFATEPSSAEIEIDNEKVMAFKNTGELYNYEQNPKPLLAKLKEPCAIVVRSNVQSNMQSLLRKYKYDANGVLIPSSVRYYIKVPQGIGETVLVPLSDKSVSHLGGFVRYYKEVPPIPHAI